MNPPREKMRRTAPLTPRLSGPLAAPLRSAWSRALGLAAVGAVAAAALSCGGGDGGGSAGIPTPPVSDTPTPTPQPPAEQPPATDPAASDPAANPPAPSASSPLKATVLPVQFADPWGMVFLPDGRMLVTQRYGNFAVVKADASGLDASFDPPFPVFDVGQGGLLDVALDPDFAANQRVFWTFSERQAGGGADSGTAVASGTFTGNSITDAKVIYRQFPKTGDTNIQYGSRLAFRSDKTLYVTLGDRGVDHPEAPNANNAQNVARTIGKVVRITRDGAPAPGNPTDLLGSGALPEIWSVGHRNPQGAAVQPGTDDLWLTEHGPRGGDELNRVLPGKNYGWPLRSYGCPYTFEASAPGCRPGGTGGVHAPDFVEPKMTWLPVSTAPSGLLFYTGDKFPEWKGQLFAGALAGKKLWRIPVNGSLDTPERFEVEAVTALGLRIRNVAQGPDGFIYLLSTEGQLVRLER